MNDTNVRSKIKDLILENKKELSEYWYKIENNELLPLILWFESLLKRMF